MSFDDVWNFARTVEAPVRNANGLSEVAPINVHRLDHDMGGKPIGLIVDLVPVENAPASYDDVQLAEPAVPAGEATVLHAVMRADGTIERTAHYTTNANETIDACLRQIGRHRSIGVAPGYLKPRDNGFVRYRGQLWRPPAIVLVDEDEWLGARPDVPLITG